MSTRKSLLFSFLDRYASLAISIGSSMVIARLLTPAEIGVFSVTMVLLMLVASVRDMGAGSYLVQERDLTEDRIRAVWAVQLGLGVALACLVLLASYPVSLFYKESRMREIMLVIALNYALNPFGSLTYAWLMREMRFDSLAMMRFLASIAGAAVSIGLAWAGWGPISLAFGSLASTMVNALMAVYFRPAAFPWLPGTREVKRVLLFGSGLSLSSVIGVLSNGAPELLLGKLQSLTAAGLYSRANGLVQMFNRLVTDAVGTVCLPWFAKQAREQGSFADPFLRATSYVTVIGWTFCGGIIFLGHPVMRVLYGLQWDDSVNLARVLAAAALFGVPAALCNTALLSAGAVAIIARLAFINALVTVGFVALAASFGAMAVSVAIVLSTAVTASYTLYTTIKHVQLALKPFFATLGKSAMVASLAAIGPALALLLYGADPDAVVAPLAVGMVVGAVGMLWGTVMFKHPLNDELQGLWAKFKPR